MNRTDLIKSCEDLLLALGDLDGMNLSDKVKMLRHIIPENCKSRNVQKCIINNNLSGIYPNMIMALNTLLTIPVRVASAS